MHYVKYKKWWQTKTPKQAGEFWLSDHQYCPFPEGTPSYYEYWDEQEEYIKNGYSWPGPTGHQQKIHGLHYLYLNYCPIHDKKKKTVTFPDFWALDADYFNELGVVLGLVPEPDPFRPVVFEVSKSRQTGASLKGTVPLLYNMCFVPFSKNYLGTYLSDDAEKTCNMFLTYFYHAQRYAEFGKRFIKKEEFEYYKTGYFDVIDGEKVPSGFQSELRLITWKDNPEKGVGGPCDLFIIDEAGLHPYLTTSLGFIIPACLDGDYTTGNILAYGAAGKEGQCDALNRLHHNPGAYRAKEYENIWEPDSYYKRTGYFIPNYACRKGTMDEDGNPDCEQAIKNLEVHLEKTKAADYEQYLLDVSQFANKPSDMFASRGKKRFQQKIIQQHIAYLEANKVTGTAVELAEDKFTKEVKMWIADEKVKRPIRRYPLTPDIDVEGCIEIFEFPDANPPAGLYIGGIDSYNQQDSYYSTSLGSVIIYKRIHNLTTEGTFRLPVAEFTGRPKDKYDFYRICAYLAKYYNAILMLENEDQEATPWFYNNNYDHLLADQPDIIRNIIPNTKVMGKRQKGIHAVDPLIIAAENKIERYLNEDLGIYYNDDGQAVGKRWGVSRILSLGLLYELMAYVHDNSKNFDRVRTFGWTLLYEDETFQNEVQTPVADNTSKFLTNTKRFSKRSKGGIYIPE